MLAVLSPQRRLRELLDEGVALLLDGGERGGGGEYTPQVGFGWTNGVVLWLLERYAGTAVVDDLARERRNS